MKRVTMLPEVMPEVAELQRRRYRAMSPAEKLACADALWELAWDATKAGVRMRHPEFDESAVILAARAIFNLHKLRFRQQGASDRHLRDIRGMLRVLGNAIDRVALEREAMAFGLTAAWDELESLRDS